jgi:hypothetical protein
MPRDLHPSDGARYLLDRDGPGDGAQVRYRAAIYTPDAEFATTALLDDAGGADLGPSGAPDDLHARLLHLCRLVARDAARLRADGLPPWPQRILRWRR